MRWIRWTMVAVAGILPSLAHAEEPAIDASGSYSVTVKTKPTEEGEQKVFEIGAENSPLHLEIFKGTLKTFVNKDGDPNVFVVGDDAAGERKVQLEVARGTLQSLLNSVKREKGSYLGVNASSPPSVLRKQLSLPAGMGLVVEFVVPDSPAGKAGLQQYDVLQKFDDQLLVNLEQLAVLVRSHKPGDEVKLAIIRDGKPQTLTAKLAEHELEPLAQNGEGEREWTVLRRMVPEPHGGALVPGDHKPINPWGAVPSPFTRGGGSSVTWMEGDNSYTIATDNDGHKNYIVKDKEGKVVFQGPMNTAEQRGKLSPELKEKLEKLESHMGGKLSGLVGEVHGSATNKDSSGGK